MSVSPKPKYIIKYLKKCIIYEISRMINTIHLIYPKIITETIKQELINHFINQFKIYKMTQERTERLNARNKYKLFKRNIRNKGFSIHKRIPPEDINRCNARIWGEGKVIKNPKNPKELQYGDRCFRKHISNELYCKQHLKHNTHGDFDKPPDNKTLMNFRKYCKSKFLMI